MYTYRVGEEKDLGSRVLPKPPSTVALTLTSAKLRLYRNNNNTLLWERDATVSGNTMTYRMTDVKTPGTYKVQWVYVVAGETRLSDPFTLTVKATV